MSRSIFKKVLRAALLPAVACLLIAAPTARGGVIFGDVNGDGEVTVADATMVVRIAVGLERVTDEILAVADVAPNPGTGGRMIGDGLLTMSDATLILRLATGMISRDEFEPKELSWEKPDAVLFVDLDAVQEVLLPGKREVIVPVRLTEVDSVAVGRARFTVSTSGSKPSTPAGKIVRVTRGDMLPESATLITNPEHLTTEGVASVMTGFMVAPNTQISGAGILFNFVISLPRGLPAGSAYDLALSMLSFADKESGIVSVVSTDSTLALK
jgi:hypothetical protein